MFSPENLLLSALSFVLFILLIKKSRQLKQVDATCKKKSALLDAINLPIFCKNKDGEFIGFNKKFDTSFDSFKKKALENLREFETTCVKECELTYDNGIKKITLVSFTNYSNGSIGILFDIDQMKKEKLMLLKKVAHLELALKGSQDGYWKWDVDSNKLTLSKKAKEILGYKEHEKEPKKLSDWMNLVEPYDIARTNEAFSLHERGESAFVDEEHRIRTASEELWVNFRGKGIYNTNNKITKVYGTIRDISALKKNSAAIIQQRDLFISFMDNLPALSFIKDEQNRYIYVNNYYQKLLGIRAWKYKTEEEIFGKELSKSIIESNREAFYEGKYKHEEYIPSEDGEKRLFLTYKFPVEHKGSRVLCGIGIDITNEKYIKIKYSYVKSMQQ